MKTDDRWIECNSILNGASSKLLNKPQYIQNSAASLLTHSFSPPVTTSTLVLQLQLQLQFTFMESPGIRYSCGCSLTHKAVSAICLFNHSAVNDSLHLINKCNQLVRNKCIVHSKAEGEASCCTQSELKSPPSKNGQTDGLFPVFFSNISLHMQWTILNLGSSGCPHTCYPLWLLTDRAANKLILTDRSVSIFCST